MENLNSIIDKLQEHKGELVEKYGFTQMAIFGSYARKQQNKDSDVDIMVEFNQPIGIQFIDLAEELEKILSLKVDLVSKKGIKEKYYKSIESELAYV